MAIKEFFRKLNFEVERRKDAGIFALLEFYFPNENPEHLEDLPVGESITSVSANLHT